MRTGASVSGAMILLHWDPAGSEVGLKTNVGIKQDLVLRTDQKGNFVAELPLGFYDLFVSATAFTPACKIRLNGTAPAELRLELKADPAVMRELDFRIAPKP